MRKSGKKRARILLSHSFPAIRRPLRHYVATNTAWQVTEMTEKPKHPFSGGKICRKGSLMIEHLYNLCMVHMVL